MKILLTTHQFLPEFFSGTEILAMETARELKRLGHDVNVVTGFPGKDELPDEERFDHYEYDGIPVERFHHALVPMGEQWDVVAAGFDNRFFARHFREYLLGLRPDLVHIFHLARISASVIDVCHELGIPVVMTPTDFWLICPTCQLSLGDRSICPGPEGTGLTCLRHMALLSPPSVQRTLLSLLPDQIVRALMRLNSAMARIGRPPIPGLQAYAIRQSFLQKRMNMLANMIVPTRLMERLLLDSGLAAEKIVFSRFGINTEQIVPHVKGVAERPFCIGFIGTLVEHKGAHLLVQAARSLPRDREWAVKIYGGTELYPAYVDEVRQLIDGDPRIQLCGTFPNERISEVFAAIDVLVVPSVWYENTPLVIYSAQAAACPVIATNLGGMAEVMRDEEDGLLFEPGDAAGLAEALLRLLDDRALLRRLSENARRPKTIAEYVADLLVVYADLLPPERAGEGGWTRSGDAGASGR